ncbi:hypothetical protein WA158_003982 [Blastocystis sp. Blastoise]
MFCSAIRKAVFNKLPLVASFSTRAAQVSAKKTIGLGLAVGLSSVGAAYVLKQNIFANEKSKDSVFSWGFGQFGQLGHGGVSDEILPRRIDELEEEECTFVAAGGNTTAVITADGSLWTFGQGENDQLGHGITSASPNESIPRAIEDEFDDKKVIDVAIGVNHCAAVTEDGAVYSWGRASMGRLGQPNNEPGCPGKVAGLENEKIVKVSVGNQHTLALTEKGEVYAWGNNKQRCLGVTGTGVYNKAVKVEGLEGSRIQDISCGLESSMCLTDKGEVYTWGSDDYGQLGHGSGARYIEKPTKIKSIRNIPMVKIVSGEYHCLALSNKNEVYAWGRGNNGQTCNAKCNDTNSPKAIEQLKDIKITQIAAGGGHSAVVDEHGTLYTFGRGRHGQLGRGDKVESIAAYRVDPTPVEYLQNKKIKQVVCGGDHTVAIIEH